MSELSGPPESIELLEPTDRESSASECERVCAAGGSDGSPVWDYSRGAGRELGSCSGVVGFVLLLTRRGWLRRWEEARRLVRKKPEDWSEYSSEIKEALGELLSLGLKQTELRRFGEFPSAMTLSRWRREDPTFRELWKSGQESRKYGLLDRVEEIVEEIGDGTLAVSQGKAMGDLLLKVSERLEGKDRYVSKRLQEKQANRERLSDDVGRKLSRLEGGKHEAMLSKELERIEGDQRWNSANDVGKSWESEMKEDEKKSLLLDRGGRA